MLVCLFLVMSTAELKKAIHEKIELTNDEMLLNQVIRFLDDGQNIFDIPEEQLESIHRGIKDLEEGRVITLEQFKIIDRQ